MLGLAGTFAAGAITGLMVAPKSGQQLRKDMEDSLRGFVRDFDAFFNPETGAHKRRKVNVRYAGSSHTGTLTRQDHKKVIELMNEVDDILTDLKTKKS